MGGSASSPPADVDAAAAAAPEAAEEAGAVAPPAAVKTLKASSTSQFMASRYCSAVALSPSAV